MNGLQPATLTAVHPQACVPIQAGDLWKIGLFRFWQIRYLAANSKKRTNRG
jgi:hypothetical protein